MPDPNEAFERALLQETEIAIKVIDRWWSIKELGQEIKQLTQERDEARAALRVRTKERDAALEAIQRMKEANESLKNKNN